jgi:hypothetical protein
MVEDKPECFVLGLVGATGSGKTTLAQRLKQDHGFVHFHIGQRLKDMLQALGLTEEDVAGTPEQRARPHPLLGGKSPRYALSTLGTDWGRNMITPDLWANTLKARIEDYREANPRPAPIVIDDLRFPDDWAVVQQFSGIILTIRRPEKEISRTPFARFYYKMRLNQITLGRSLFGKRVIHESEFHWRDAPSAGEVWNTGEIADLVPAALSYCR